MKKVLQVAWQEFRSTAITKAFIIGVAVVPLIMIVMIPVVLLIISNTKSVEITGTMAVIDRTGKVTPLLQDQMSEEAARRRAAEARARIEEAKEQLPDALQRPIGEGPGQAIMDSAIDQAVRSAITLEELPADADVDSARAPLSEGSAKDGGRVALVVIEPWALDSAPRDDPEPEAAPDDEPAGDAETAGDGEGVADDGDPAGASAQQEDKPKAPFSLYVKRKMPTDEQSKMEGWVRRAIANSRLTDAGHDPATIRAMLSVRSGGTQEVTEEGGTRQSNEVLNTLLPFAFIGLLMMSVMIGGQYLLTTTIEEKSSRVVEILLSAVSPMELMTGKVLGQLCVGLAVMLVYSGLGLISLIATGVGDLVSVKTLVYLLFYFLLAYLMIGSFMAAIGSAVNEMREAQSLLAPVTITLMIPWFLWFPVSRAPSSMLSVVLSMVPPVSPFAMVLRLASTEPPPDWQVVLSILICAVAALGMLWLAGKVFRVGLLMFGKPPSLGTLIRWVRMA